MSDIQSVIVYMRQPTGRPGDLGTVDHAFFKVKEDVLTLTDQQGAPLRKINGEIYSQSLGLDDSPRRIAGALWKSRQSELDPHASFYAPINYPPKAIV